MNVLERLKITDGTNFISIDNVNEIKFDTINCEQLYCFSNSFDLAEGLNISLDNYSLFNLVGKNYDFNCNFLCKINELYCDKFEMDSINKTTKNTKYSSLFLDTLPGTSLVNGTFNFKVYTDIVFSKINFTQTISTMVTTSKTTKILRKTYSSITTDNINELTTVFDNISAIEAYVTELHLN